MISSLNNSSSLDKKKLKTFEDYPTPINANLWLEYSEKTSKFTIWSPTADEVRLHLYENGNGGASFETHPLIIEKDGIWSVSISKDLNGIYYTYQVKIKGNWLNETPGIYAKAVGVNGERAMVLNFKNTNPVGWATDRGPEINYANESIIYELHIRDMTISESSGSTNPGKYLGLIEENTKSLEGIKTGIGHLKELGITHVHLLPTFDHYAIDETKLDSPQYNWGYDPQNYNVPEGSFSINPFDAKVRIKEFKKMIQAFHDNGIGVILDVVYNHTGKTSTSNFNQEVPGYYYRFNKDGSYSDASACGNETASERSMMLKFMIESVTYWTQEYHIDGFRFDLMGIHDIDTMNAVSTALKKANKNCIIFGEGWTAANSVLPEEKRALKKHMQQLPLIAAFSDDFRDGLKGSVFDESDTGFVSGKTGVEESVKFGIIGSIAHPQINYKLVNYSDAPWANQPWQAISYVSCHDNHTLYDKLKLSKPKASEKEIIAIHKLAIGIVLTSQGTPFIHAGSELLRSKNGEHNSYNLPDTINQIDWRLKSKNAAVYKFYKNLIALRKKHPAFRMTSANAVRNNLEFIKTEAGLISYKINNHANGDSWKSILVIYNAHKISINYKLNEAWKIALNDDHFFTENYITCRTKIEVKPIAMAVLFQN
ncbi:type I pullulanase [Aurantibacter crassamenti]|uniref:type I pullulanase n=1 Tax=Aurantibacter crassamenti TaxID=1837375 RepID=UPI001939A983|nr:type I pullulanase [Aurantibacter crassamenti]MBM1107591.1 type I pullulanase [Aurantibacter crassamenti]